MNSVTKQLVAKKLGIDHLDPGSQQSIIQQLDGLIEDRIVERVARSFIDEEWATLEEVRSNGDKAVKDYISSKLNIDLIVEGVAIDIVNQFKVRTGVAGTR